MSGSKTSLQEREKAICKCFNSNSISTMRRHDGRDISITERRHVNQINSMGAKSALDVGSGSGSILLELLKSGIDKVIGVDLSPKINELARIRIQKQGFSPEIFIIHDGSFLDLVPIDVDAISLHRVLCCHPDRLAMLEQSIAHNPKILTITIPRTWLIFRFLVASHSLIARITNGFRTFIHSKKSIDQQLINAGYKITSRNRGWIWITTSYIKEN